MSTLYMIRHGQASFGTANYDKLSDLGITQAKILAHHLIAAQTSFDVIYTGTLVRQKETAQELIALLEFQNRPLPEIRESSAFDEYSYQDVLEKMMPILVTENPRLGDDINQMPTSKAAFQKIFEMVMLRYVNDTDNISGLMKWNDYVAQVNQGLDAIMASFGKGRHVAVFTSGGPISIAVQKGLGLSNQTAIQVSWQIVNASMSRFKFTYDRFSLSQFNEFTHLELDGGSERITYR